MVTDNASRSLTEQFQQQALPPFDVEALDKAYVRGGLEAALKLIEPGFDYDTGPADNLKKFNRPLLWAIDEDVSDSIALKMIDCGASVDFDNCIGYSALMLAALKGRRGVVQRMLEKGAPVDKGTLQNASPLSLAASMGNVEIMEILIEHGADPGLPDNEGKTPLMQAAKQGKPKAIDLLLAHGVAIDAFDVNGTTALMWAVCCEHSAAVTALVAAGAPPDAQDDIGNTALMYASWRPGDVGVVKMLLAAGADPRVKNKEGKTAFDRAIESNTTETAQILFDKIIERATILGAPMTVRKPLQMMKKSQLAARE